MRAKNRPAIIRIFSISMIVLLFVLAIVFIVFGAKTRNYYCIQVTYHTNTLTHRLFHSTRYRVLFYSLGCYFGCYAIISSVLLFLSNRKPKMMNYECKNERESTNKTINILQVTSAILQRICSCIMIFYGVLLLFLMAIYDLSNSDVSYYTPWLFLMTVCAVSFAIALIILTNKLLHSSNSGKSIAISIAIIILNSILILLWIVTVASQYGGYVSVWPFVVYCLPLIPLIAIIAFLSTSMLLNKQMSLNNQNSR